MARGAVHFLPISLSPRLPVYYLGDSSMDSRHGKLIKVFDRDPFLFPLPINGFAVINMKGKLEVRIGLFESSDRFSDFDIHSHVFPYIVS